MLTFIGFLCAAVFFCGFFATKNTQSADAYTSSGSTAAPTANQISSGNDIVLSDYATRTDGLVFDYAKLNELYGKLVKAATGTAPSKPTLKGAVDAVTASSSKVKSAANDSDNYELTQSRALDFNKMKTNLGSAITLKFGGYDWTVVYATTNTTTGGTTKAGDLIVTLWMNDNITTSKWSAAPAVNATNVNYPTNMYSSSYIRVKTLNAGGDDGSLAAGSSGNTCYSSDTSSQTTTVTLATRKSNQFAKFTLSNAKLGNNTSLTDFLTMPKDVAYQEKENFVWSYNGTGSPYLNPNEAWGNPNTSLKHYTSTVANRTGGWYSDGTFNYNYTVSGNIKAGYNSWSNDYLWLPSMSETGYYHSANDSTTWGASLWGIPITSTGADAIIQSTVPSGTGVSDISWLRSGGSTYVLGANVISSSGAFIWPTVSSVGGVRPALHLNLTQAAESAAKEIPTPTNPNPKTYNGQPQGITTESWYTNNATAFGDTNHCEITYKKGSTILTEAPKDVGTYTAEIRFTTAKYFFDGSATNKLKTVNFTITPITLNAKFELDTNGEPKLTVFSGLCTGDKLNEAIKYYDSSGNEVQKANLKKNTTYQAEVTINNSNYVLPSTITRIDYKPPVARVTASFMTQSMEYNGLPQPFDIILVGGEAGTTVATAELKGTYDSTVEKTGDRQFTATNADKYKVTLSLTNKDDYVWDSTGKSDDIDLEFEITPITVKIYIPSFTPSNWAITQRYKAKANLELPSLESSDTLTVILSAFYNGNAIRNLCAIGLDSDTHVQEFELETDTLSPNTYGLGITYDDPNDVNAKNYNVILDKSYSFTIKQPSATGGIIWRLMQGSMLVGSQSDPADIDTATFTKAVTYNGKSFVFVVNADGLGYTVDSSYNSSGFVNGYKTVAKGKTAALTTVTNAGEYVTTVRLSNGDEYHIEWKIDKVKFDLSKVRWLEDGQISYNERGMTVELDPDTIPEGLTATVNSVTPATVGQSSTATVTFTVDDPTNYEVPVSGDKDTYTFKGNGGLTDFEWEKTWTVIPAVIPVKWTVGMITVNGKKVSVQSLAGGYDSYLKYVYYATDESGTVPEGAEALDEPVIEEGVVKYYVAEVSIKSNFDGKYVLEAGKSTRSPVFEAGKNVTMVQLSPKKTAYPYNGQPVDFQFEVTQGTIAESAFEIVYYKGMLKQANPPKDVGSYRAQIKLKSEYERDYYIDGDYTFDFTIDKAVIAIDWDNGTIPSSLKLKNDEKSCITYEYSDSDGNSVGFGTLRTTAGTYNVRAVIKSAYQKNYIFDNDEVETEWKSFEITEDDIKNGLVVDPNDPDGNKQYVEFKLESETGAKGTTPQISNEVGLTLGTDYSVEYLKDGEPATNFLTAGKYVIRITLLGDNADKYILITDTLEYTITDSEGEGSGTTTPNGEGGGSNGGTSSDWTIESILPIILSGISLVLIVVFSVMACNNASAAKEARAKTKKLATMTYSFAPASLLMLFGLSYGNWWIVAGVLMGLALMTAIIAFMMKGKKKKALVLLEEEQERIEQEKEYAREEKELAKEERAREEQARRDNEMRMMFAAMQQNYQQPQGQLIDYDMLQNMINSSVQALLPNLQQLQALPPASFDVNASISAEAQKEIDGLHEQIAQQQEMLSQILQNQQNYVMPLYEEEVEDDTSWLGDSDELISLEESYGALSDEGKRFYYEIGSHIMNKPRTSQNDGRYAVLFRCRGKTLFKLAIKNDAPVLYYPAGGGRDEVRVSNASSLELAKSIIDRIVMSVDS